LGTTILGNPPYIYIDKYINQNSGAVEVTGGILRYYSINQATCGREILMIIPDLPVPYIIGTKLPVAN